MGGAVIITSSAALGPYGAWNKQLSGIYLGRYFIAVFIVLAVIGHFHMKNKHKKDDLNATAYEGDEVTD
jgi:hypothetical protein